MPLRMLKEAAARAPREEKRQKWARSLRGQDKQNLKACAKARKSTRREDPSPASPAGAAGSIDAHDSRSAAQASRNSGRCLSSSWSRLPGNAPRTVVSVPALASAARRASRASRHAPAPSRTSSTTGWPTNAARVPSRRTPSGSNGSRHATASMPAARSARRFRSPPRHAPPRHAGGDGAGPAVAAVALADSPGQAAASGLATASRRRRAAAFRSQ